jgi:hypothetical protein
MEPPYYIWVAKGGAYAGEKFGLGEEGSGVPGLMPSSSWKISERAGVSPHPVGVWLSGTYVWCGPTFNSPILDLPIFPYTFY